MIAAVGKGIDRAQKLGAESANYISFDLVSLLERETGSRMRGWDLRYRAFVCAQRDIRVVGIRKRGGSPVRREWPNPKLYKKVHFKRRDREGGRRWELPKHCWDYSTCILSFRGVRR